MTTFLSASNLSKTSTNTSSKIISSNSVYGALPTTNTIFKLENTNDYSLIQVSVKATKSMNILVQQSFDNEVLTGGGVPSLVSTEVIAVVPVNPINSETPAQTFYATITYPYFRIILINTSGQVGSVYLTTKLITTPTTISGGISILNPTEDGVSAFGSANNITPIQLNTDGEGNLNLNDASPIMDGITLYIKGNNNIIFPQDDESMLIKRMLVTSQNGDLATNYTLSEIAVKSILNRQNGTEDVINFFAPAVPTTTYQEFSADSVIPNTTVDTSEVYTVMAAGEFLTNSENPPSTTLPQFNITRRNPANDIFSIQSNLGLNAFAGKTIFPLNGIYTTGIFTASNPGDSGMTFTPEGDTTTYQILWAFNITTPLPTLEQFYTLLSSRMVFSAGASDSIVIDGIQIVNFSANRVTIRLGLRGGVDFPALATYPVSSLSFTKSATAVQPPSVFCPPTTLINSSSSSSGGFCDINTNPVNLTNSGDPLTQMKGATLYIFTPVYQAFVTTPPAYVATNNLAFEYSNDNTNWFGGATNPQFSLLVQTLPPIPYVVPYSRYIYNFSIQSVFIITRYVRIKAAKRILLRLNYFLTGMKGGKSNPLRLL